MVKVLAGSVVGGLVAGTIALVATAAGGGNDRQASPELVAPSIVQCEPHQQAVMRRAIVDGREASTLSCVTVPATDPATVQGPLTPDAFAPAYAPVTPTYASLTTPTAQAPVAVARPAAVRQSAPPRAVPRANKRSWTKSALVIGGTGGAGAGIGALVGGKKGALIGAAIGGGSGAIYEATKRK